MSTRKGNLSNTVCVCVSPTLSHVQLFVTPWTGACQALLSVKLSRQEYWSRLSFPIPGDLSDTGIQPRSSALQADSLPFQPPGKLNTI